VQDGRRVDAVFVEIDEGLPVTEAQWVEHSEAWRRAHLDRAPSAFLRQQAISGPELAAELGGSRRSGWAWLPHLGLEMMVIAAIAAVVVIVTALR
jgi:hypothetical protein